MNNEIDVQNYGVSLGFSLGPILVIVFMMELENIGSKVSRNGDAM